MELLYGFRNMIQSTSNEGASPGMMVVGTTVVGTRVVGGGDVRSLSAKIFCLLMKCDR